MLGLDNSLLGHEFLKDIIVECATKRRAFVYATACSVIAQSCGKTPKAVQRDIAYVLKDVNDIIDRVRRVFNVRMNPYDFHPKRFVCCIADIVLQEAYTAQYYPEE